MRTAPQNTARPAVFLDKDGTLLHDVPYNVSPAHMNFAPGARVGLQRLARLPLSLVVVSNQPGVALGRFPESALSEVARRLREMFTDCGARLAGFYWCPHATDAAGRPQCDCRKPNSGLLRKAAEQLQLDLQASWMVGDILDDIEAGRRVGCESLLIDNGNETEWKSGGMREPHRFCHDFGIAARHIENRWQARQPDIAERPT